MEQVLNSYCKEWIKTGTLRQKPQQAGRRPKGEWGTRDEDIDDDDDATIQQKNVYQQGGKL